MKTTFNLAVAALILSFGGLADAAPYGHDHRGGYDERGYSQQRHRPRLSLSAQAQLKLRTLGYYRGPIDGDFGPGSRRALVRFQRDHRLPVTARLDGLTRRALRI